MKIVAVTACPTGIAHTYMAAEALERAAKKMGHIIKVETQGSIGIENKISVKEVAEADLVILAVDVSVKEDGRFRGKPLYKCEAQLAIKNAQKVIEEALKILK
jgi:fructose-specific PTS system IIB-like component